MTVAKTRTTGRKERTGIENFMARHAKDLADNEDLLVANAIAGGAYTGVGFTLSTEPEDVTLRSACAPPARRLMEELKSYWCVRLLKEAMDENNPAAYREILEGWLIRLIGRVPDGVFVTMRGTPGNVAKKATADIHKVWIAHDKRTPTQLAAAVHGRDFLPCETRGPGEARQTLRWGCQKAGEGTSRPHTLSCLLSTVNLSYNST